LSAQGFGNAPRDLTIQHTGSALPNDFESGCVGVAADGSIIVGSAGCRPNDAAMDPNGVIPVGGDEPNPQTDAQKYNIPTLASLGIINASQIGILFNATEPGGDSINVLDITLSFFRPNGTFITSIDGQQNFPSSFAGNGIAGFVFRVDPLEVPILTALVFSQPNAGSIVLALSSSLANATSGPDTFRIINLDTPVVTAVPEPPVSWLFALALFALVLLRRERNIETRRARSVRATLKS